VQSGAHLDALVVHNHLTQIVFTCHMQMLPRFEQRSASHTQFGVLAAWSSRGDVLVSRVILLLALLAFALNSRHSDLEELMIDALATGEDVLLVLCVRVLTKMCFLAMHSFLGTLCAVPGRDRGY
jgi:hypothetical protein